MEYLLYFAGVWLLFEGGGIVHRWLDILEADVKANQDKETEDKGN